MQRNISNFFWVVVAVAEVVMVTHSNHALNYKHGKKAQLHSGSLAHFEKCNFNSSPFLKKIHCKTLAFKSTKKNFKKFQGPNKNNLRGHLSATAESMNNFESIWDNFQRQ